MSQYKYTIEQIELVRKLRNTGITKQQLIYAFEELERRDGAAQDSRSSTGSNGPSAPSVATLPQTPSPPQAVTKGVITYSETPELLDFKTKGDEEMLREIKAFVAKFNIRQNMIAEMTRISQGYISRYFRGEGDEMSERAKNLIYMWYLQCKNNPQKLQECLGNKTILTETGDLMPIRRERFLFSKVHIEVLERYFQENRYPDSETKEAIAEACNTAFEAKTGRQLKPCDRVTPIHINNWFNNKRKELKSKKMASPFVTGSPLLIETFPDIEDSQESYDNSFQYLSALADDHAEHYDSSGAYSGRPCSIVKTESQT